MNNAIKVNSEVIRKAPNFPSLQYLDRSKSSDTHIFDILLFFLFSKNFYIFLFSSLVRNILVNN